jgi:methylthioribose-1-phosphate isomerase
MQKIQKQSAVLWQLKQSSVSSFAESVRINFQSAEINKVLSRSIATLLHIQYRAHTHTNTDALAVYKYGSANFLSQRIQHSCMFARFIISGMRCNYIALLLEIKRENKRRVWLECFSCK